MAAPRPADPATRSVQERDAETGKCRDRVREVGAHGLKYNFYGNYIFLLKFLFYDAKVEVAWRIFFVGISVYFFYRFNQLLMAIVGLAF